MQEKYQKHWEEATATVEALWSAELLSSQNILGGGISVLATGRILGGDTSCTYIGDYVVDRVKITAKITVSHYANEPISVFG